MTRGVRNRLVAFVILAAVGLVYVSASYLGLVDRVLGRGFTVTAELAGTGGLYEGGQVTYRGVKIGEVGKMTPREGGVVVTLNLDEGTELPLDAPMYVHNGSAVGEQYLDFEPVSDDGPYAEQGAVFRGSADTLPIDEADLIVTMDKFVRSVDTENLSTVIGELGQMFYNTGRPLQDLIDGANRLVDAAEANKRETVNLLQRGRTVLRTQAENADSIKQFADGLKTVTRTLSDSDRNIRVLLQGGPATLKQVRLLLQGLKPTLPVFLSNLVTVNQVATVRLPALEQLLVTYPALIAGGFDGTTTDGYGHVHLEFTEDPAPCTAGYLPKSRWRPGSDLSDGTPFLQARCASPAPYNMRGSKYAPTFGNGAARVAPYDPRTGTVNDGGQQYVIGNPGFNDIYGEDAWKWMLIGPTLD
ncbi:MAG TPA: MlaD family protein [Nocardioidaceae bacterium]|nr:MlaD family protein [Nocardioidaceae bacterium]